MDYDAAPVHLLLVFFLVVCAVVSVGRKRVTRVTPPPPFSELTTMALPWGAQAAHHKASLTEGLKIVRRVLDAQPKALLSTRDIFRLAVKEQPSPEFVMALGSAKRAPWREGDLPRQPGRMLQPQPPRPNHPVRSLSCVVAFSPSASELTSSRV